MFRINLHTEAVNGGVLGNSSSYSPADKRFRKLKRQR